MLIYVFYRNAKLLKQIKVILFTKIAFRMPYRNLNEEK